MYIALTIIVLLLIVFFRKKRKKRIKANPKINRDIICDNQSNHISGTKRQFSIRQENYEFFVKDGQIVGVKNLKSQNPSIIYYKSSGGYTDGID